MAMSRAIYQQELKPTSQAMTAELDNGMEVVEGL